MYESIEKNDMYRMVDKTVKFEVGLFLSSVGVNLNTVSV